MALLFVDSFDHYTAAQITRKWTQLLGVNTAIAIDSAYGRRSTAGLRTYAYSGATGAFSPVVTLPASGDTFGCGFAFTPTTAFALLTTGTNGVSSWAAGASNALAGMRYQGTGMCWLRLNTDGTMSVFNGATVLGSTTSSLSEDTTYFIELKIVIHSSTGTVALKVGGSEWLALTNQNTGTTGASWNEFFLGKVRGSDDSVWYFDDVYVFDGATGDANNQVVDVLGDVRVDALFPSGAGATSGWTPSTGSNYACVDESTPNDETDYVSASSVVTDTYAFPDAPVAGATVLGLQVCSCERRETVGASQTAAVVRQGGTDYAGTANGNPSSYAYTRSLWTLNPSDQSVIDDTDFNAMEFGIKKTV